MFGFVSNMGRCIKSARKCKQNNIFIVVLCSMSLATCSGCLLGPHDREHGGRLHEGGQLQTQGEKDPDPVRGLHPWVSVNPLTRPFLVYCCQPSLMAVLSVLLSILSYGCS